MVLLQVYQAKALKELHEGSSDPVKFGLCVPDILPHAGTASVGAELPKLAQGQDGGSTETNMASAAAVKPLGLHHMRPLQHWLHGLVPRWAWQRSTHWVTIILACC